MVIPLNQRSHLQLESQARSWPSNTRLLCSSFCPHSFLIWSSEHIIYFNLVLLMCKSQTEEAALTWKNHSLVILAEHTDRTRHRVMRKDTQALLGKESDFCLQQRMQNPSSRSERRRERVQEMTSAEGIGNGFHCITLSGVEAARPTVLAWSYCHIVMKRWRLSLTLRL